MPMRTLLLALLALSLTAHAAHARHAGGQDSMVTAKAVPRAAQPQWDLLRKSVQRYRDFDVAKREGWKRFGGDAPLMGEHWYLPGALEPMPGEPLDFTRPSNLQYALVDGKRVLVGVSCVVRLAPGDPLPEGFAGDADHWHVHDVEKFVAASTEERPFLGWLANWWLDSQYRDKGDNRSRLAMVHAWVTLPSPEGPFSMHNTAIPYLRLGLPTDYAEHATEATANGVNLASPDGCKEALDGELWVADARHAQSRTLHDRCKALAGQLRGVIALAPEAAVVNGAGERAWNDLQALKRRTLTPRQLSRIDAMTEHDPMH